MKLAILFQFHAHGDVCLNRLRQLRTLNPGVAIYGLCLGDDGLGKDFEPWARSEFDDLFVVPKGIPAIWKWARNNVAMAAWFLHRGRFLAWDRLAVVQWDQLTFVSIEKSFDDLGTEQVYFAGVRPLTKRLAARWDWTHRFSFFHGEYVRLASWLSENYGSPQMLASSCIFFIVPRRFLEAWTRLPVVHVGYLEYSLPTLALRLGFEFYERDLGVAWDPLESIQGKPMNAIGSEIPEAYVEAELAREDGWRIFHPYYHAWGTALPSRARRPMPSGEFPPDPKTHEEFLGVLPIPKEELHATLDMFAKVIEKKANRLELMDPDFWAGRNRGKGRSVQVLGALRQLGNGAMTTVMQPSRVRQRLRMFADARRKLP